MLFAILEFGSNPAPPLRTIFHLHTERRRRLRAREGRQPYQLCSVLEKAKQTKSLHGIHLKTESRIRKDPTTLFCSHCIWLHPCPPPSPLAHIGQNRPSSHREKKKTKGQARLLLCLTWQGMGAKTIPATMTKIRSSSISYSSFFR